MSSLAGSQGSPNIAAYAAVDSDPTSPNYGQMEILRVPAQSQIDGPGQASNAMRTTRPWRFASSADSFDFVAAVRN